MQLFKSARLKLTAWYLLIILLISGTLSFLFYYGTTSVLERQFERIEHRLRFEEERFGLPRDFRRLPRLLPEDIVAAKRQIALHLLTINGVIAVVFATAGYFLAGKTLKPIEKALEEQKRFVADASHELQTPLTALKTSIEVALRDKKMTIKEAKKELESSLEDINSLQFLTNNLLGLTRYQGGTVGLSFKKVDLSEVVKSAYQKIKSLAKEKSVEIKLEVQACVVEGEKESLEEMLLIFLDNGVKFTPKGGKVFVTTKVDRKYAVLEIKDTGIGIAKKDLPHIFDRFYRADKSRTTPGFGLGLSLAKRIIEMHKGAVEVESILGKGTTFTVKLPREHS